jgi:hypothetical protein
MEKLKTDEDGKTADNHGNIGYGAELAQPFAGFSFSGQLHSNALVHRYEQMLSDTEYKEPDKHDGKTGRKKSDEQYAKGAQYIGQSRLPSGTQKKQNCGNKDNQKTWQFPGKFQKSTLKIVDYEGFI